MRSHTFYFVTTTEARELARGVGGRRRRTRVGARAHARACVRVSFLPPLIHPPPSPPFLFSPSHRTHARDIARAFTARPDLRPPICAALVRLCDQCAPVEAVAAGFGGGLSESEDEGEGGGGGHGGRQPNHASAAGPAPPQFTPAVAAATKAALGDQAKKWLPLLLNTLVGAAPGERGRV